MMNRICRININSTISKCLTSRHLNLLCDGNTEEMKKKTSHSQLVTLIRDSQHSVETLEDAKKLSRRRDLRMVKVVDLDTKTQRPIYKLMTPGDYHRENSKEQHQKLKKQCSNKGEKLLLISCNIFNHDMNTQIKKINKWIEKYYEVRVVINGDESNMEKSELLYSNLVNAIGKNGRIVQKRQKGPDIKFQILPPKSDDNS